MREADQRLELCLPVLLYCPVSESISGAGQSCVRVSAIFCTVQVLQEPKKKICPLHRIVVRNPGVTAELEPGEVSGVCIWEYS